MILFCIISSRVETKEANSTILYIQKVAVPVLLHADSLLSLLADELSVV